MNAVIDISAISKLRQSAFVAASGLAVFITASSGMAQTPSGAATEGIDELQEVTVVVLKAPWPLRRCLLS
jgi:hypothetical protein